MHLGNKIYTDKSKIDFLFDRIKFEILFEDYTYNCISLTEVGCIQIEYLSFYITNGKIKQTYWKKEHKLNATE